MTMQTHDVTAYINAAPEKVLAFIATCATARATCHRSSR